MVFVSRNGACVSFTDEFVPAVLNFTGKHRCVLVGEEDGADVPIGATVVATGRYCNLDDSSEPMIDEAIPIVELSRVPGQKSVLGVVAGVDDAGVFAVGNMRFTVPLPGRRVVVNAAGEGAIRVCGENGPIQTGDLLCTSSRRGLAMRQDDDVVRACTVAKATCSRTFLDGAGGEALVGCVYV
jgi:hypothetical protein